uniref:Prenylcysteine oxidase 1 n=1 Tax=Cyanistes caeruleus TaxID=156563 RepID=A0A8C0UCX2_CYACU
GFTSTKDHLSCTYCLGLLLTDTGQVEKAKTRSYFQECLQSKFGHGVQLHVLEKAAVGGRLDTLDVEGDAYEAGGSVIHPLNLHMKHFVKELGLSVASAQGGLAGVYNGEEFVFEESSWSFINLLKLLWHYGLNPLRMSMWVEDILDKFMRIYRYQMHDYAFSSNERLLQTLGGDDFTRLLNQTIDEAMQKAGFSQKFINEVVCPAMRVNYGQGVTINGFVGAVSLAGVQSGLWSVKGGNKLVCSGLIYSSKAEVIPGTVVSIEPKTRPRPGSECSWNSLQWGGDGDTGDQPRSLGDFEVEIPPWEGGEGLGWNSQRSCGCPWIPGNAQGTWMWLGASWDRGRCPCHGTGWALRSLPIQTFPQFHENRAENPAVEVYKPKHGGILKCQGQLGFPEHGSG